VDASVTETRLRPGQDSCLTKVLTPHTNTTMQLSFSLSQLKGFIRYIYETITLKLYISFPLCPRTCLALFLPVFLSVSLPICLSLYLFVPLSLYLSVSLSLPIRLSLPVSLYLSLSTCLSLCLSTCLSLFLTSCLSLYLSVTLLVSLYLSVSLPVSFYPSDQRNVTCLFFL
jgi:hypothetical protein